MREMIDELRQRIAAHLTAHTGGSVEVRALAPLGGGACTDLWLVEARLESGETPRLVLRSDPRTTLPGSLDRAGELAVVEASRRAGVSTPQGRFYGRGLVRDDAGAYFLDFVDGDTIGRRVTSSPQLEGARALLPMQLGRELARIHSVTPAVEPELFAKSRRPFDGDARELDPVAALLDFVRGMLEALDEPRPALELALRWLEERRPRRSEVTLVHGDFRTGNFIVGEEGLRAILDWEFARFGTPAEDLAWIQVRDWRFGRLDRPVGGFAAREPFYRAYQEASGRLIDTDEVRWWEILGNVRWALGCLSQGARYLAGDRDLELIAIARRAVEMEWEALRLIRRSS
jgi:aminoglycoside phosphotransferase (APT) family kinase protein